MKYWGLEAPPILSPGFQVHMPVAASSCLHVSKPAMDHLVPSLESTGLIFSAFSECLIDLLHLVGIATAIRVNSNLCTSDKPEHMLSPSVAHAAWRRTGQQSSVLPPTTLAACIQAWSWEEGLQEAEGSEMSEMAQSHEGSPAAYGLAGSPQPLEGCSNPRSVPTLTHHMSQLSGVTWWMLGWRAVNHYAQQGSKHYMCAQRHAFIKRMWNSSAGWVGLQLKEKQRETKGYHPASKSTTMRI